MSPASSTAVTVPVAPLTSRAARGAAAGVEEHPVPGLVLPPGRPPRADQSRAGEGASSGEAGADPVCHVLGVSVRDDQCGDLLGAVAPDVGAYSVGHRAAGLAGRGQLVLPAVLGTQLLGCNSFASAEQAQRLLVGRVDVGGGSP